MEQQLINALMKLISKAGGGSLVKDLIQQVDENGNPKVWTPKEIDAAVRHVQWQTEHFGTAEAILMIQSLLRKHHLRIEDFHSFLERHDADSPTRDPLPDAPGVHGLN